MIFTIDALNKQISILDSWTRKFNTNGDIDYNISIAGGITFPNGYTGLHWPQIDAHILQNNTDHLEVSCALSNYNQGKR